jgi:hypothetical protein
MILPKIEKLEFVRSLEHLSGPPGPDRDLTWFLVYTGTLYFCVGGAGMHGMLFAEMQENIPSPPAPREGLSKMNSVAAAGRIKEMKGARLHLWGSKDLGVTTPSDWYPTLKKILEEQVIPQVLAAV